MLANRCVVVQICVSLSYLMLCNIFLVLRFKKKKKKTSAYCSYFRKCIEAYNGKHRFCQVLPVARSQICAWTCVD